MLVLASARRSQIIICGIDFHLLVFVRIMEMTKVLVFSKSFTWFGGVVNFIEVLKNNLSSDIAFVHFEIGRRKSGLARLLWPFIPLIDSVRLIGILIRQNFDAYHVNPSLNVNSIIRDGLFLIILRAFRASNVIVSFHGWEKDCEDLVGRSIVFKKIFLYVYSYAQNTLVLADEFKSWLIGLGFDPGKVSVFTTMFDSNTLDSLKYRRTSDECRLLFLSRLVREKGVYELADAFKNIASENKEASLVYAGNGPEECALKKHVKGLGLEGRVTFAGYVRGQDKVRVLDESDIFVFPTYYGEGCPVALLEAMAAALPVITTPVGGIPNIVQPRHNGILLNSVDAQSIAEALRELLDDKQLRKAISENNRKDAWSKYSAPVVTRIFERLYRGKG